MRVHLPGTASLALVALLASAGAAAGQGGGAEADPRDKFVGTWKLLGVERHDADGNLQPPPEPGTFGAGSPLGYIMYDGEHMAVIIQQEGRLPYAGAEPTPDEALAALTSYTSYFGPYTVNEAEGYVTHHVLGSINPGTTGQDNQRFYEFSDNRLILQPPPGPSGGRVRIIWEKVPDKADLTAEQHRFLGFWAISHVEQRTLDGDEPVPTDQYAEGYIIYMPSGHMAVHLMREAGRQPYAGARPTGDEAIPTLASYGGYFGSFIVKRGGYVLHRRTGAVVPASAGVDAQRFYDFQGDQLILMPGGPREVDGVAVRRFIHWDRISNLDH